MVDSVVPSVARASYPKILRREDRAPLDPYHMVSELKVDTVGFVSLVLS